MKNLIRSLIFALVFTLAIVQGVPRKQHHAQAPQESKGEELSSDEVAGLNIEPKVKPVQKKRADVFMCGSDETIDNGESGEIYSPGFPAFYPNNQDCFVNIDQPAGVVSQTLQVTANSFWTERNFDFLYIYYGDAGEFIRYTGNSESATDDASMPIGETLSFQSTTGALRFRFTSDISVIEPGFNVTYSVTADGTTPPPATGSPTAGSRCTDVSGSYRSTDGANDLIIEQDKDPTDTDYQVAGIYRNNSNSAPIWLQFLGHSGAGESQSYGISFTVYGETNLVTYTGLCEECSGGRQLDLYEVVLREDNPDCSGSPTINEPIFVRFLQVESILGKTVPKKGEIQRKRRSLTKRN